MEIPRRKTVVRARSLRRRMTLPEVLVWRVLRRQPGGFRFRRQHPIGDYVLDFFCPSVRLAIEIDGIAHEMGTNVQRDARRDEWLRAQNISILRIPAQEVLDDLEAAVTFIITTCAEQFPSTGFAGPPPRSGEDL